MATQLPDYASCLRVTTVYEDISLTDVIISALSQGVPLSGVGIPQATRLPGMWV